MRILLDATTVPQRPAGAGRYALELARALAGLDGDHELIVLERWGALADLAKRSSPDSASRKARRVRTRVLRPRFRSRLMRGVWEQSVLPALAFRLHTDILHSTHHSLPLLPVRGAAVVTVHDLNTFLLPDRYPPARRFSSQLLTELGARRAEAVIVPSHSVAADLLRRIRLPEARIHVVAEAAAASFCPQPQTRIEACRQRLRLPERYILSLGTIEPGKNRATLLRAFLMLHRRVPHHLIVAGQRGWLQDSLGVEVERLGIQDRVHFLGYVSEAELPALYGGADLFVFPSWREGFGLPPLEAMACGTPVVSSNAPALPEVLGDAALYTAPGDAAALAGAIERCLVDRVLWNSLRDRGLRRASRYSWERAAQDTLTVYRSVIGG